MKALPLYKRWILILFGWGMVLVGALPAEDITVPVTIQYPQGASVDWAHLSLVLQLIPEVKVDSSLYCDNYHGTVGHGAFRFDVGTLADGHFYDLKLSVASDPRVPFEEQLVIRHLTPASLVAMQAPLRLTIQPLKLTTISITLVNAATGEPVARQGVRILGSDGDQIAALHTDEAGQFKFVAEKGIHYTLALAPSPALTGQDLMQEAPLATDQAEMKWKVHVSVCSVDGDIKCDSEPLLFRNREDYVEFIRLDIKSASIFSALVCDGRFQIWNLEPGTYQMVSLGPGVDSISSFMLSEKVQFKVKAQQEHPVTVHLFAVPKPRYPVVVHVVSTSKMSLSHSPDVKVTDQLTGRTVTTEVKADSARINLAVGSYTIVVRCVGYGMATGHFHVDKAVDMTISLRPLREVSVMVANSNNIPLSECMVIGLGDERFDDRTFSGESSGNTGKDGLAKLLLPEGDHLLLVCPSSFAWQVMPVKISAKNDRIVITCGPGAMFKGHISLPDKSGVEFKHITLVLYDASMHVPRAACELGADGTFSIQVVPGKYSMVLSLGARFCLLSDIQIPVAGMVYDLKVTSDELKNLSESMVKAPDDVSVGKQEVEP